MRLLGDTGKGTLRVFGTRSFDLLDGELLVMSGYANYYRASWYTPFGILYLTNKRLLFGPLWSNLPPFVYRRAWDPSQIEGLGFGRTWYIALATLWFAQTWYVMIDNRRHYFHTVFKGDRWLEALSKATGLPAGAHGAS